MRLLIVDAFTDRPFAGNPAAVVVVETRADEDWMQSVAAEMNLPETAFLRGGGCEWELRWFSPVVEVDLCGHATLASAHALWSTGMAPAGETLRFATRSGTLTASPAPEGVVALDFPAEPVQPVEAPPGLLDGLGARALFVGRNRLDTLVEVDGEATVRGLTPDLAVLATLPGRGFMVRRLGLTMTWRRSVLSCALTPRSSTPCATPSWSTSGRCVRGSPSKARRSSSRVRRCERGSLSKPPA